MTPTTNGAVSCAPEAAGTTDFSGLSDEELLARASAIASQERVANADLIEHLAEIEKRDLCPGLGYASLYEYCIYRLKMSDGGAYRRIRAVRTYRAHPPVMTLLREGRLSVESLVLLHPFADAADFPDLVRQAVGMRTRSLEAFLSGRHTAPPRRDVVRFIGAAAPAPAQISSPPEDLFSLKPSVAAPPEAPLIAPSGTPRAPTTAPPVSPPVSARRVRIAFTADEDFHRALAKTRALLRHKYPDGRLDGVFRDALQALLERRDPVLRWAASSRRRRRR